MPRQMDRIIFDTDLGLESNASQPFSASGVRLLEQARLFHVRGVQTGRIWDLE